MIVDSEDKKLLIDILTDKLLSTEELSKKERIIRLLQRMRKRTSSGYQSRSEIAAHYGISRFKLYHDINSNERIVNELMDTGWTKKRAGFYPIQIAILQKYFGL